MVKQKLCVQVLPVAGDKICAVSGAHASCVAGAGGAGLARAVPQRPLQLPGA